MISNQGYHCLFYNVKLPAVGMGSQKCNHEKSMVRAGKSEM